jgi:Holliday junction resolvase
MKKKVKKKKLPAVKPKKRINSRAKGKVGELEFSAFLKERGIEARRGQQFKGGTDSPDVVAGGCVAGIHFEVKRVQAGNLYGWHDQACADADLCKMPVVAHRRNNKRWLAILDMRDFITLAEMAHGR